MKAALILSLNLLAVQKVSDLSRHEYQRNDVTHQ